VDSIRLRNPYAASRSEFIYLSLPALIGSPNWSAKTRDNPKHSTSFRVSLLLPSCPSSLYRMEDIKEKTIFSRPRLLSATPGSQVVRCNYKIPTARKRPDEVYECVLKIFPSSFRISYEKELSTYRRLIESDVGISYPDPLGCGEWPSAKYIKTIGQRITSILKDSKDSTVFVLMLGYVDATPLSSIAVSTDVALAALSSLAKLHALGIVHGDLSTSNIFVDEEQEDNSVNIVWMDFSSSWTEASPNQLSWEMDRALEYFAAWVWPMYEALSNDVGQYGQIPTRAAGEPHTYVLTL
jgi:hypothetical protein